MLFQNVNFALDVYVYKLLLTGIQLGQVLLIEEITIESAEDCMYLHKAEDTAFAHVSIGMVDDVCETLTRVHKAFNYRGE